MTSLLTDEVMAAVVKAYNESKEDIHPRSLDDALHAFIAAVEGERKCDACWDGRPKWAGTMPVPSCPACNGTGKVRDDKLVLRKQARAEMLAEVLDDLHDWLSNIRPGYTDDQGTRKEGVHNTIERIEREFGKVLTQ